ncbi:MAG: rhomboid family intramembrane serine protease [bacterium]
MQYYDRTYRLGFGGGITHFVKYLLIINIVVFLLQKISPNEELIVQWLGLSPQKALLKFHIWQFGTYMFLHGGVVHLFFNMLFLWMFGCEVERTLGSKEFLKIYAISGLGAGLLHTFFSFDSIVVGASGAIYGIMVAFAVLFPDRVITLLLFFFLPINIKAKYLVMVFVGISLLSLGSNDGVAHFAHLGGAAVSFAYLKFDWRLDYLAGWFRRQRESRRAVQGLKRQQAMYQMRERVDEILDKINEVGYDQLNEDEKRILKDASQRIGEDRDRDT